MRKVRFSASLLALFQVAVWAQAPRIVSRETDAVGAVGTAASGCLFDLCVRNPVTDDGVVVFVSVAQLSPIDGNVTHDLYLRQADFLRPISVAGLAPDSQEFGDIAAFALSSDGLTLLTFRAATAFDDPTGYLWDLAAAPLTRTRFQSPIPLETATLAGNGFSAAMVTSASLLAADTNALPDVYSFSVFTQQLTLLSRTPDLIGNGPSTAVSMSDVGFRAVFSSTASNLTADPVSGGTHTFLYDASDSDLKRLDLRGDGSTAAPSLSPSMSGDGEWVAFVSEDPELVPGDNVGSADVFAVRHDGTEMSRETAALSGNAGSPAFNQDGRFLVFTAELDGVAQIYLRDRLAGTVALLSQASGTAANADCLAPAISPAGRYVTFVSAATSLAAEANGVTQVYLVDRGAGFRNQAPIAEDQLVTAATNGHLAIALVSADADGDVLTAEVLDLPSNGKLFAGETTAADEIVAPGLLPSGLQTVTYAPNAEFSGQDSFTVRQHDDYAASAPATVTITVSDPASGIIQRITIGHDGAVPDGDSGPPSSGGISISAAGDGVGFVSLAANLVPNDLNFAPDAFVWHRQPPGSSLVSAATDGTQGSSTELAMDLSADGRYAVFATGAALVAEDQNTALDVYRRDLASGVTKLLSHTPTGPAGNGSSRAPSISADGSLVAFTSVANDLTGIESASEQLYVWEAASDAVRLVSGAAGPLDAEVNWPALADSGVAVVFSTTAGNLLPDADGFEHVYIHWLTTGVSYRVSAPMTGQTDGDASRPSVSAGGRFVAFDASSTTLVPDDLNGRRDVFLRDLQSGEIIRLSQAADGNGGDADALRPALAATGRTAYFRSAAENLVSLATAGRQSGFRYDRQAAPADRLRLVSHAVAAGGDGNTQNGDVSADGRYIAFVSDADNLTTEDGNGRRDVFISDFGPQPNSAPASDLPTIDATEDTELLVSLAASDADDDDLVVRLLSGPDHGTASLQTEITPTTPWPVLLYTPDANFSGADSVDYTVTDGLATITATCSINVIEQNDEPTFEPLPAPQTVAEGETLTVPLQVSDPDQINTVPDVLTIALVSGPGAMVDGNYVFTPGFAVANRDMPTVDVPVVLEVTDGRGGQDQLAFSVAVTDVNQPPAAAGLVVAPSVPTTIDALAPAYVFADSDGDLEGLTQITWYVRSDTGGFAAYTGELQLSEGRLQDVPSSATSKGQSWYVEVTPRDDRDDSAAGATVGSAAVTIVNSPPQPPLLSPLLDEDSTLDFVVAASDADDDALTYEFSATAHGELTIIEDLGDGGRRLRYHPAPNFSGEETVSYRVSDDEETVAANLVISVQALPDPPELVVVRPLIVTADEGVLAPELLAVSDADEAVDPTAYTLVIGTPTAGAIVDGDNQAVTAALLSDLPLRYLPATAGFAVVSVTLRLRDPTGLESPDVDLALWIRPQGTELTVAAGWNLLALPGVPLLADFSRAFSVDLASGAVRSPWTWDGTTQRLQPVSSVAPGQAFWAFAADDYGVITVHTQPAIPGPVAVSPGWNAVGLRGDYPAAVPDPAAVSDLMWRWRASEQRYQSADVLPPGAGALIYVVNDNGQLDFIPAR